GPAELVRIEIAERPHTRQQQRRPSLSPLRYRAQKGLTQSAHSAPRRQQNANARQKQRIAAGHLQKPASERRQERALGHNRVDFGPDTVCHGGFHPSSRTRGLTMTLLLTDREIAVL